MSDTFLVSWDGRPAISFSPSEALAILTPGGSWTAVDGLDVRNSGRVIADDTPSILFPSHDRLAHKQTDHLHISMSKKRVC